MGQNDSNTTKGQVRDNLTNERFRLSETPSYKLYHYSIISTALKLSTRKFLIVASLINYTCIMMHWAKLLLYRAKRLSITYSIIEESMYSTYDFVLVFGDYIINITWMLYIIQRTLYIYPSPPTANKIIDHVHWKLQFCMIKYNFWFFQLCLSFESWEFLTND